MGQVLPFSRRRSIVRRAIRTAILPAIALAVAAVSFGAMSVARDPVILFRDLAPFTHAHFSVCGWGFHEACVIDGDTIRLHGEKIRLADINTPETHEARCPAERALGDRATERLVAWMNEGPFEVRPAGYRDRDRYGRLLRTLERNGQSVGAILVAEGLAERWTGRRSDWCVLLGQAPKE